MVAAFVLLVCAAAAASAHKSEAWANGQFASAEHLHQALEARPAQELTRPDYQHVINAYRRIYFEAPTSTKADPSVVAVAGLLEEMGRRFDDTTILNSAVTEYEFLRRQYPGSKARFGALFRIGEIYKDDLHDKKRADEVFRDFLRFYPRNQFAEEARKALAEPATDAVVARKKSKAAAKNDSANADQDADAEDAAEQPSSKESHGELVGITGIRHWSTADSTHVAIDLKGNVKYEAQRIDHPDRIFFDLFDTKLDPSLKSKKNIDIDEALLKKIRISQFTPRRTRVVLEVGDAMEYHASLVSDPPRLVIDLRDKSAAKDAEPKSAAIAVAAKTDTKLKPDDVAAPELKHAADLDGLDAVLSTPEKAETALPKLAKKAPADEKSGTSTTVITKDGIKKVIVDPDGSDDEVSKVETPKAKVAKVEAAEVRPVAATDAPVTFKGVPEKATRTKLSARSIATREAQPTAAGDRSLIRALGLKIGKIVIDPGHGGHDTGTIGPGGLEEKDLVLDVSKRLGKILASRLGAQVIYTRDDDTFIPLEMRTAIANQEGADLFISVHANSSDDPDARGVETYYLNFTSSPDALEVASRENAVSDKSIHELQDLVKKIALKEKIEESREFAVDVDHSLHSGLAAKSSGIRDRGVKKAPFIVLIGANMPSILAEISFLSNPGDERRLKTGDFRQRIAESLYRGVANYVNGLSGVKVASKIEKTSSE